MKNSMMKKLAIAATALTLVVVVLGAFTRLMDAGLGCPDWPGCYNFLHIPTSSDDIAAANQAYPEQPYEFEKAWPEMVHRYVAGTLGLLVLALAILGFRQREAGAPFIHPLILLAVVTFQAILGMWTVTMKLHPVVVMAHLLGGLTTFSLLASLSARLIQQGRSLITPIEQRRLAPVIYLATVVLILQIALGGWTSANYASVICNGVASLPICQGDWIATTNFAEAFHFWGLEAENYQYGVMSHDAMIAIHASHRIGAMIASAIIIVLIVKLFKSDSQLTRQMAWFITGLLTVQILLGISNVVFQLPLAVAVAHNGVAALLLISLAVLVTQIHLPEVKVNSYE